MASPSRRASSDWRRRRSSSPRTGFCSRPSDAVSVATTCARTCVACSSCASCATLRGRGSSTGIGVPSVAGGPGIIGTMRSASRIASSTLLVIITVVTGRSPIAQSRPAPAAASRASARRARRTARRGTAPRGSVANARAIATRWRMPPESWPGRRLIALPSPTCSSAPRRAPAAARASSPGTPPPRPAARSRARRTTAAASSSGRRTPRRCGRRGTGSPSIVDRAAIRRRQPGEEAQQRRLAAAHRADDRDELAALDASETSAARAASSERLGTATSMNAIGRSRSERLRYMPIGR